MSVRRSSLRSGEMEHGSEGEEEMNYQMADQDDGMGATNQPNSHALSLEWCVGFNYKLVNGVINLTNKDRKRVFYAAGNTGVIYDFKDRDRKQYLLQGHCNEITCVAYCPENDILVTADKGPSSLMVIWDAKSGVPQFSIFDPHEHGVESLDITSKGDTIVTLSREEGAPGTKRLPQTVKIWVYGVNESGTPNYYLRRQAPIDRVIAGSPSGYDYQKFVHINKWSEVFKEFATTGEEKIYFWQLDDKKELGLKGYQPPNNSISKKDKKKTKDGKEGKGGKDHHDGKEGGDGRAGKDETGDTKHKTSRMVEKNRKGKGDEDRHGSNSRVFTQTVFIPKSQQAVSGTDDGLLVVWDISLILEDSTEPDSRRETKSINLLNWSNKSEETKVGISVLLSSPLFLIIGATNGQVQFYDYQFRLVSWFENDHIGEVTSISVSYQPDFDFAKLKAEIAKQEHYFNYPDFIVVDKNAKIVEIKAAMFNETGAGKDYLGLPGTEGMAKEQSKNRTLILESIPGKVNAISSKPDSSEVVISCENGIIYRWDFAKKEHQLQPFPKPFTETPGEKPTCLQYSPDGEHLVVATTSKDVHCFLTKSNYWQKNIMPSSQKQDIKGISICFAESSDFFGMIDDKQCVSLFRLDVVSKQTGKEVKEWSFVGRIAAHHGAVNDLAFVDSYDNDQMRKTMFFSIGQDKTLVEYDVTSGRIDKLEYREPMKIEHEVAPKSCLWYPVNRNREPLLLVATEDYKLKLWNVKGKDNKEKVCYATFLGPTYGGPINKMMYLRRKEEIDSSKYVAYATAEKIVGIIKLPLDGNPNKTMGMIAHPNRMSSMSATSDGKFLFTSSADDIGILNMWFINYASIDEQEKIAYQSSNPLDIYPNLLEGGKDGQIFRDLKDFFYFTQIDSNTNNPTKAKKLDGKIPATEVPNLMRALGYYPTVLEAKNMINEVYYSNRGSSEEAEHSLGLDTFVKLFINHRPVYGLTTKLIRDKLEILKRTKEPVEAQKGAQAQPSGPQVPVYSREQFIEDLTSHGNAFTHEQLKDYLNILFADGDPRDVLPETITPEFLVEKLLGMEDENEEEPAKFVPDHSN